MPNQFRLAAAPGDPNKANEDFTGALGDCAILLDGSGAPGNMPTGCVHGVPWFVRQLGSRCLAAMVASPQLPLPDVLAAAISEVAALHADSCDLSVPGTPSCVLTMARISGETFDYLVLGDVVLVVEDMTGAVQAVTDKRMTAVAADEYKRVLASPIGTPEHLAARVEYVTVQQPLRNQPGGYPVASTDPASAHQAVTGSRPAADVRRAAMMSDGVSRFEEFGLGSWGDLLRILAAGGPDALFARIREAENTDPDGRRWPRAKRHDDVSAVFWQTSSRPPVVAAIVTSPLGVLVGRRNDRTPPWTFIAGEQEPGETVADTAIREVKEETGLRVQVGDVIGSRPHPDTGRVMVYIKAAPVHGTNVFVGDEAELSEVRWASLADAIALLPGMHEPVLEHLYAELDH